MKNIKIDRKIYLEAELTAELVGGGTTFLHKKDIKKGMKKLFGSFNNKASSLNISTNLN